MAKFKEQRFGDRRVLNRHFPLSCIKEAFGQNTLGYSLVGAKSSQEGMLQPHTRRVWNRASKKLLFSFQSTEGEEKKKKLQKSRIEILSLAPFFKRPTCQKISGTGKGTQSESRETGPYNEKNKYTSERKRRCRRPQSSSHSPRGDWCNVNSLLEVSDGVLQPDPP